MSVTRCFTDGPQVKLVLLTADVKPFSGPFRMAKSRIHIFQRCPTVLSSSEVVWFTWSPHRKLQRCPRVVPYPSTIVEHIIQPNPDAFNVGVVPALCVHSPSKSVHLLHGIYLDKVTTTLFAVLLGLVPCGVPWLEEVASCGKLAPRIAALLHGSCCFGVQCRQGEALCSTRSLTRVGAFS